MPGLFSTINISPDDLATLKDVPRQVEALAGSTKQMLQAIQSGADSGNPVGALIGGLSTLSEQAGQLPALEPLLAPVRELSGKLPTRKLGDIKAIGGEIDRLLGVFGGLKDAVLSGDIETTLRTIIEQVLDQTGNLLRPGDEVGRVLSDLESFLRLFGSLIEWRQRTPSAEEVAALISQGLAGFSLDTLTAPVAALEAALKPLDSLAPTGPDRDRWQAGLSGRADFWRGIDARVTAGVDWGRLEADLQAELRLSLEVRASRDRLFSTVLASLPRVNLSAVATAGRSAMALPSPRDFRLTPLIQGLRRQIENTASDLESWNPTEDEARALIRSLLDRLLGFLEDSPLGQLRTLLINLQQRLLTEIEGLPFRGLAKEAEDALMRVARTLSVVNPDVFRKPIREFFGGIEKKIDGFAANAVPGALTDLWGEVEKAIQQINVQIDKLRVTLEGLSGQLQTFTSNVQPTLTAIKEAVTSVRIALEGFDLEQSAETVIDTLHELRDQIKELDFSVLPAPAVSNLKSAAEFLRDLDIAGTVNPPLTLALEEVDPSVLLVDATGKISGITAQLKLLDPVTLAKDLDKTVDDLLAELSKISPDRLRGVIKAGIQPVEDAIGALDLSQVLAPLTRLHAELMARIDAVLNPDAIFAPLNALFKPVVDLIDGLQPSRFVSVLTPHGEGLIEKLGTATGPPGPITAANLKEKLPAGPEIEDDLFGFRIGDLLIPLIDLHRQLTEAFDRLDDGLIGSAAGVVSGALQGRLGAFNPASVSLRVNTRLAELHTVLDPGQVSSRLADAIIAYHSAAGKIAQAARTNLAEADAAVAGRVLAVLPQANPLSLVPERAQFDGVLSASTQLVARLDLSGLRAAVPGLARIESLIPEFLRAPQLTATAIRQALRDLDPAPIRDEINELFDRVGRRIVALKDVLFAALEEVGKMVEEFLLPVSPGNLVALAERLHEALKQQLLAFHPNQFKDEVQVIFDTVKGQVEAFDPSILVEEMNQFRQHLIDKLRELITKLVPGVEPFHELQARLALLKPSKLLEPLIQSLTAVSKLVADLDPKPLLEPLLDAIVQVRERLPDVIAEVEAALDELLAAFPEGDTEGAAAGATVSVG